MTLMPSLMASIPLAADQSPTTIETIVTELVLLVKISLTIEEISPLFSVDNISSRNEITCSSLTGRNLIKVSVILIIGKNARRIKKAACAANAPV